MWILIALQLMAGSGTAKNSYPVAFSGVTMQEFSSKDSCEQAIKTIKKMNERRNGGEQAFEIRNGIIELQCVNK
jgi:uncharacterized protein YegP (UPF0339 family)